eukprot:scaffold649559_cov42-Prasinocladus_malaysianus.AAC.1
MFTCHPSGLTFPRGVAGHLPSPRVHPQEPVCSGHPHAANPPGGDGSPSSSRRHPLLSLLPLNGHGS